jgi:hypothetical protein
LKQEKVNGLREYIQRVRRPLRTNLGCIQYPNYLSSGIVRCMQMSQETDSYGCTKNHSSKEEKRTHEAKEGVLHVILLK